MEAPDKIFVREYPDGINQSWDRKKRDDVVATVYHEYIRKDALLEWAEETYLNENASAIRKVCYKQLIDKIESL